MRRFRKGMLALTATMVAMSFMACNNQEETTPNNQIGRDALPEYFHITSSDTQLRADDYDTIEPVSMEEIGLKKQNDKVDFSGILDVVEMNNKRKTDSEGKPVQELYLTRESNINHNVTFYLKLNAIGKMPGHLVIEAPHIFITPQTGEIVKQTSPDALKIDNFKFTKLLGHYDVTIEGRIGKAYKGGVFQGYILKVKLFSNGTLAGVIDVMKAHVETHGLKK